MVVVEARIVDSTHLELSRPLLGSQGATVVVSISGPTDRDTERADWLNASSASLTGAYGAAEPDYPVSLVKESNPVYGT